ncbi:hypothetical protein Bca52824_057457 [Brassica carinata]|uniref:DUF4283 domain-containing protein n=1 Tax=Brassica carinata TaxID=52824 RepID=A0A8X7QS47_BRACI|nr:hypothetical protein Bca52824_057457 [Brassica carinata]
MGSLTHNRSAYYTDMKGKAILYEDDDEPIKLVDRERSFVIKEFHMTLIGKILNPKKQNVEKLLQKMPSKWGLSERITTNDIGNRKFLFNFMNEEDLNFVLRQGPFHFNFCMFVLVRWELIVHDDYPWIVPFWVQLVGFPLHLWTDGNLRNIGGRIGHVDTLELAEGRMLIDIDSRKPLKFSRKVEYKGDEVTLEIKYDKLFKHCTTCGMLSHEKEYCPTTDVRSRIQPMERRDVFSRVQPEEQMARHHLGDRSLAHNSNNQTPRYNDRYHNNGNNADDSGNQRESRGLQSRTDNRWHGNNGRSGHADRIIRDELSRGSRYGGSRSGLGPYDRPQATRWRAKPRPADKDKGWTDKGKDDEAAFGRMFLMDNRLGDWLFSGPQGTKKIASAIVTPSRLDRPMEDNVTVRNKGETRALAFSPSGGQDPTTADDQIIGALSDMELVEQSNDGMEEETEGDDLLGVELMEMEGNNFHDDTAAKGAREDMRATRAKKHGSKRNAPLGIKHRKFEILRRGSPSKRLTSSRSHVEGGDKQRSRHATTVVPATKHDGLMSSKNSSKHY